jgi:hypothetical protein
MPVLDAKKSPESELSAEASAVLVALRSPRPVREWLAALEQAAGGSGAPLFQQLDVLRQQRKLKLVPELAVEIALTASGFDIGRVLRFITPLGAKVVPHLEAKANALLAQPILDGHAAAIVMLSLWEAKKRAAPPPKFDELLNEALRFVDADSMSGNAVVLLRELVARVPMKRRELLVFGDAVRDPGAHGHLLWTYAGTCPTEKVIAECIQQALSWERHEFNRALARRDTVIETFRALSKPATTALIAALRSKEGERAPQRDILLRALGESQNADAAATLFVFTYDASELPRRAAFDGLIALGDKALPLLAKQLANGTTSARLRSAEVWAALAPSKRSKERAKKLAKLQKNEEIRLLLRKAAGLGPKPPPPPAGEVELNALRRKVSESFRERVLESVDAERLTDAEVRAAASAEIEKDLRALVVYADRYLGALQRGQAHAFGFDLDFFAHVCRARAEQSPAVPYLAAQLLVSCPDKGTYDLKSIVPSFLDSAGPRIARPLAAWVARERPEGRKHYLAWLAERDPEAGKVAFLAAANDPVKANRALAISGLSRLGADVLPEVWPLLSGSHDQKAVAAEVLRAVPSADSISPLRAALSIEAHSERRELLQSALSACELVAQGPAPINEATLDAQLASRAPAETKVPELAGVRLRWRSGQSLSDGAVRWLLAALAHETPETTNAELSALRPMLDDADCHALSDRILQTFPSDSAHKWVLYQLAILGSDAQLDAFGSRLGELVYEQSAALAAHGVHVLRRAKRAPSIHWLDHWARVGTHKLRSESNEALRQLSIELGATRDDLVDGATPTMGFDEQGRHTFSTLSGPLQVVLDAGNGLHLEDANGTRINPVPAGVAAWFSALERGVRVVSDELKGRIEAAMLTGRRWTGERWRALFVANPLARNLSVGLLFGRDSADGLFYVDANHERRDARDRPVELERNGQVQLLHPLQLDDDQLAAWRARLDGARLAPPFLQLHRPFVRKPQRALLDRLQNATLKTRLLLGGLERLGYRRGEPQDAGMVYDAHRLVGSRWLITFEHDGFSVADGRNPDGELSTLKTARIHSQEGDDANVPESLYNEALSDLIALLDYGQ